MAVTGTALQLANQPSAVLAVNAVVLYLRF
jgi:hypothetical protein